MEDVSESEPVTVVVNDSDEDFGSDISESEGGG